MRIRYIVPALLFLIAFPALSQKITIDRDHAVAFSEFKTFQFRETRDDLRDTAPYVHNDVVRQLRQYAIDGGLEEVESDPDVYIAYYTADQRDLYLGKDNLEYSYGENFDFGDYWDGGVGTRTPEKFRFREGTMVIDVWEAETKLLVWRGIATAALSKDPDKNAKKVDKALKKIMKKWDEEHGTYVQGVRKLKDEQGD